MKKLFTLGMALCAVVASHAQTPVVVMNSDFEDTTTPLALNANNQYAIKGFYLANDAKKPAGSSLDASNSGLASGMGVDGSQALRLTCVQADATQNAAGHIFDVTTDTINIGDREFGEYTATFQEKVTEAMSTIRPTGFVTFAYDMNMLDVTTATLTVNKTAQTALNATTDFQTIFGYQKLGTVFSLKANAAGLNAKYVKIGISIGKNLPASLTTAIYLDNFAMVGPAVSTGFNSVNRAVDMKVYPSLTKDFAQVTCAEPITELCVYSATGTLVSKIAVGTTTHKLDITKLSKGVYFITAKTSKGTLNSKINKI